jgi:hypothetical protein
MKKTWLYIILATLIFTVSYATDIDGYFYWVTPGTRRTIAWDAISGADKYEVSIRRLESGRTLYQGFVTTPQITVKFNSTGHNVVYIRAISGNTVGEWQNTLDPVVSSVNGKPKAWVIVVPTL